MLQYLTKTEKTAKSVNDAKELALKELGIDEQDAEIEVVDEGSKGFLGIGSKSAKVIVSAKDTNSVVAKSFLSQVFDAMDMDVDIKAETGDESLNVEISGEHMGIVIGKRGDTLDALQYLTSLVVNRESEDRIRVILDTENYREKRQAALISLSNRLSEKVYKSGKKYTLEPMNPYERRIIHSNLQASDKVTTFSIGEEPYRKVVIAPKNAPKPRYTHTPAAPSPSVSHTSGADYRKHNYNKHKSFDEFISGNTED